MIVRNLKLSKIYLPVLLTVFFIVVSGLAQAENPELIETAKYSNAEAVQLLLKGGADPDLRQTDGATALHWATYRENLEMVNSLIAAGANVNAVNRLNASSLYLAAKAGNAELIAILLKAGATANQELTLGETAVMTAARAGSAAGVQYLIDAGADVNAIENSREQTALMWAAAQGHVGVVSALVNAGADLDARSKERPRLMFADATNGGAFDQGINELLGGFSPLLFAAREGHTDVARLLLDAGAEINGVAANGTSPLVVAAHSGHSDMAQMLIEKGADTNLIGAGYNALHAAILRGDLDTVVALLKHGADPDTRLQKPNPVQRASEDWALKTPLVGATPFWIAANFREAEIMRALANGGADPMLANQEQWSRPRERADRASYTPQVIGGFASTVQAAITGDSTRGRFYVQPNSDPAGEERLALAAVIAAADLGVNLNHRDHNESTAMHDAAARGLPNIIRELAGRGADVNALNNRGMTPLDLALRAERRPNFFGFDLSVPGSSASDVLQEFGGVSSSAL